MRLLDCGVADFVAPDHLGERTLPGCLGDSTGAYATSPRPGPSETTASHVFHVCAW